MFTDEIRKATIQGVIKAMSTTANERDEWRASFQDLLAKLEGKITQDETNYLQALVIVLSDADRMTEADDLIPASFAGDWRSILEVVSHKLTASPAGKSVSLEARQAIMNNTVAVLTSSPERKADWLTALRGLQKDARSNDLPDFDIYASALIRLLEGASASYLAGSIPSMFVGDWETITRNLT